MALSYNYPFCGTELAVFIPGLVVLTFNVTKLKL